MAKPAEQQDLIRRFKMVYSESLPTFSDARKREAQIKRWTRAKKEALVTGDMVKLRNLSKSRNRKIF